MKRTKIAIIAALVFMGAAFCLDIPPSELLMKFFRQRLKWEGEIEAEMLCCTIANGDTTILVDSCTIDLEDFESNTQFSEYSPFALKTCDLLLPITLAKTEFDSIAINKTRTRVCGIMCWKMKLYFDEKRWDAYISGDNLFRVMKIERNRCGKAESDDTWSFLEISKDRDFPVKIERVVDFGWGDSTAVLISRRELRNPRLKKSILSEP